MDIGVVTDMLDIILRSIISVLVLFVLTRIMGKKQIAQLTFFDYVAGISMGSIAAELAVDKTIPYSHGIISLVIYVAFPIIMSYWSLKSLRIREWLDGVPTVIIQNGKFIEKNLRKVRFHVNDVLEECRIKGVFSISDVEFAILETSGQVSIQLKSQKQPVTPEDLNLSTQYKGISAELIIDGVIMHEHLKLVNLNEQWLISELQKHNTSPDKVLLATLDTNGKLNIDLKNHDPKPLKVKE